MKQQLLILPAIFLLAACGSTIHSQNTSSPGTLTIDATGEVQAPANRILFQIHISRFHEEASTAFEEHKKLEQFLTQLILDQNIPEEQIDANPINISPRRHSNQQGFETRQSVLLRLDEISGFEKMQIILIENGFDNFSANFGTSEEKSAREDALKDAISNARHKAGILASSAGRMLGKIDQIEYTTTSGIIRMEARMAMDSSDDSLLQFQKTVTVRENVRVRFELTD